MADGWGSVFGSFNEGPGGSQSTSEQRPIPEMINLYKDALSRNQANYNNILSSYATGEQRLNATLPSIYRGYGDVLKNVQNTLGFGGKPYGVLNAEMERENQKSAFQGGNIQQQMINRGLGNTTVLANMQNQNELFRRQSMNDIGARLAGMYSGAQERIGQAGLGAQMQGLGMQTGLSQARGSTLGGYRFQEPGPLVGGYSQSTSRGNQAALGGGYGGGYGGGKVGGGGGGGGFGRKTGADLSPYGDATGQTFQSYTPGYGGGAASSYNPFIGTPPRPGGGGMVGGKENLVATAPGGTFGILPEGAMGYGGSLAKDIDYAQYVSQFGNLDNPLIDWEA